MQFALLIQLAQTLGPAVMDIVALLEKKKVQVVKGDTPVTWDYVRSRLASVVGDVDSIIQTGQNEIDQAGESLPVPEQG